MSGPVQDHLFVIVGATGDLTRRKLLPALFRVMTEYGVADQVHVLGTARSPMSDAEYRTMAVSALREAGHDPGLVADWCEHRLFYESADSDRYGTLAARMEQIERDAGLPGNRAFYLALPPAALARVVGSLDAAGLNRSRGWTRIVIEKPFGHDLDSAMALNDLVHRHFDEDQIYRIDHYLGKETVQNLLTFRFANPIFESTWNRDRVEAVEITVAEDLGVGTRAGYYDSAGVVRDMVQSHLTQVMTMVAMEPPSSFRADAIRNEKVQVLESIAPIEPTRVVYGQYTEGRIAGRAVPGYLREDGIPAGSQTPTFAGIRIDIPNLRWSGVPFFLRTGKRLPRRTTQVALTYRRSPICIFHGAADGCALEPNVILLTLQPGEGFEVRFELKTPGQPPTVVSRPLTFDYEDEFEALPDAYQTLLHDVMTGDQTLFVRADEVREAWRVFTPILDAGIPVHPYPAGTWGPAETNRELALWTDDWTMRS